MFENKSGGANVVDQQKMAMFYSNYGLFRAVFGGFAKVLTDIRTDGRTDRPLYRDARTHLKTNAV